MPSSKPRPHLKQQPRRFTYKPRTPPALPVLPDWALPDNIEKCFRAAQAHKDEAHVRNLHLRDIGNIIVLERVEILSVADYWASCS